MLVLNRDFWLRRDKKRMYRGAALVGLVALIVIIAVSVSVSKNNKGSGGSDELVGGNDPTVPAPSETLIPDTRAPLPSDDPTTAPLPSLTPQNSPTPPPVSFPTPKPPTPRPVATTMSPVMSPAPIFDTEGPTVEEATVTYRPGHLTVSENGLRLSEGLKSRIIARKGQKVQYDTGGRSAQSFHERPDFGACFPIPPKHTTPETLGGWVCASNSEMEKRGKGGVGAFTFNSTGHLLEYKMILTGTTMNCGGGRTPWNTWISCEEDADIGQAWQVDPMGIRTPEKTTIGSGTGRFESFAYDHRDREKPKFYLSEDQRKGALRRFRPNKVDWSDPWTILHEEGPIDFLVLEPESDDAPKGTFSWTPDHKKAKTNAERYYPQSEGIDRDGPYLYMVCKNIKALFILHLDDFTYERYSTEHGIFDGAPDQMKRILKEGEESDILYFTEENGPAAGIHGRNKVGQYFTVVEGPGWSAETTGLSFSPDGKHMYFAFQDDGVFFDVWREDEFPFNGKTLNVQYHNQAVDLS